MITKMDFSYRQGTKDDLESLKELAIKSWSPFQNVLTEEHWSSLKQTISNNKTYQELIDQSICFVCLSNKDNIIGMAFLVPNGNPTDLYPKDWSYIRFVSVDPAYGNKGIGRKLTIMCIKQAKENGEKIIALHTSEIMDKARYIYESLGFRIFKEIDQRLGKRYWLYKLDLREIEE